MELDRSAIDPEYLITKALSLQTVCGLDRNVEALLSGEGSGDYHAPTPQCRTPQGGEGFDINGNSSSCNANVSGDLSPLSTILA